MTHELLLQLLRVFFLSGLQQECINYPSTYYVT